MWSLLKSDARHGHRKKPDRHSSVNCSILSDSATPWIIAFQAPLSMEFCRQEFWSGLPLPPPRDLPHPGTETVSPGAPVLAGRFFTTTPTQKDPMQPNKLIFKKKSLFSTKPGYQKYSLSGKPYFECKKQNINYSFFPCSSVCNNLSHPLDDMTHLAKQRGNQNKKMQKRKAPEDIFPPNPY